jgi:RNA polymerase sigma-70 factor (ECF subfamily)
MGEGPFKEDPRGDGALTAAANNGDESAFEALYFRYRDWVVGLAYRFTGNRDDALDVLQDTFAYFFSKFPGFELRSQLKTFLYPAVRNLALARRRKIRRFISLDEAAANPSSPDDQLDELALSDELSAMLAPLDAIHSEVVLLRFVDGLSLPEIAEAIKIPVGTAKSRLHNALRTLRDDPRTQNFQNL